MAKKRVEIELSGDGAVSDDFVKNQVIPEILESIKDIPTITVEPTEGGSHVVQPSEQVKEQSENVEE